MSDIYCAFNLQNLNGYQDKLLKKANIPRIGCVAWQNTSQTRQICRIYIRKWRVILEKRLYKKT